MAIDLTKEFDPKDYDFEILREWNIDGHAVAAARFRGKDGRHPKDWSPQFLFCDQETRDDHDSGGCPAKHTVRESVMAERRAMHGAAWKAMPLEDAILEIHARVESEQWLGQHYADMIYVQEVAVLLGADFGLVRAACDDLFAKRKLQLNGMILRPFERRFRLPKPLTSFVIRFVGDPLGYPNGDAGECALGEIEKRMQKKLCCDDGADAFGRHWPKMDPAICAEVFEGLVGICKSALGNPRVRARILKSRTQVVPDAWLAPLLAAHPEIRKDALHEFRKQFVRLVRLRIELYHSYGKRPLRMIETDTLKEVAEELEAWAKASRERAGKKPPSKKS